MTANAQLDEVGASGSFESPETVDRETFVAQLDIARIDSHFGYEPRTNTMFTEAFTVAQQRLEQAALAGLYVVVENGQGTNRSQGFGLLSAENTGLRYSILRRNLIDRRPGDRELLQSVTFKAEVTIVPQREISISLFPGRLSILGVSRVVSPDSELPDAYFGLTADQAMYPSQPARKLPLSVHKFQVGSFQDLHENPKFRVNAMIHNRVDPTLIQMRAGRK